MIMITYVNRIPISHPIPVAGQKTFVRVEELIVGQSLAVASPGSTEAPQLEVFCGPESKGMIEASFLQYI